MTPPPERLRLRVMTVNVHKGFGFMNRRFILHELREAVRAVGADLVFLQEVIGVHRGHVQRVADWPQAPQVEFLADSIWPQFAYGRNAVHADGDHGNALLSKYPIVAWRNHDVSISGPEQRGLLHCVLHPPGWPQPVHAVCVHLGLRESHRQLQLRALCRIAEAEVPRDEPLVVAGDFNDWRRRADAVLERGAGLREVFVTAHGRHARTFPARMPTLALDRIYVRHARAHRPVVLPRRPWSQLSDHAPLAAEIHL